MPRAPSSRREFLKAGAAAALAITRVVPAHATADPSRIALVVGNNSYRDAPLSNAINDARAMGTLLERAGFTVTLKTDANRDGLREAATVFGAAARSSETRQVYFYYAGHGAQLDWRNYLLPVDAQITTAADLPAQCLELGVLLNDLSKAKGKVFVLILDACRDDPFGAAYRTAQKGLSQFDAPVGSLLAFSTAPGSVAADGGGQNGLYTENLVRELAVKGARIEDALKRVRLAVRLASHGAQIPWESTSLESDVYLFPTAAGKLSEAELEADFQREIGLWNRIKGSKQTSDWIGYLREYPGGKFTEIAQNRLNYLLRIEDEREVLAAATVVALAAPASTLAASASVPALPTPPLASVGGSLPQLVIGPGLPVPVLMRPSPNPLSAGTYTTNRRFSVGDEVTYAESEPVAGTKLPNRRFRVTRVDEDADRIEVNDGDYIWDTLGNTIKNDRNSFDPRLQYIGADLQAGKKFTTRCRIIRPGFSADMYFDFTVVGREKVHVPAGEFEAFRHEASGFVGGSRMTLTIWATPGFNFYLKYEFIQYSRTKATGQGEMREMISCRQVRWNVA